MIHLGFFSASLIVFVVFPARRLLQALKNRARQSKRCHKVKFQVGSDTLSVGVKWSCKLWTGGPFVRPCTSTLGRSAAIHKLVNLWNMTSKRNNKESGEIAVFGRLDWNWRQAQLSERFVGAVPGNFTFAFSRAVFSSSGVAHKRFRGSQWVYAFKRCLLRIKEAKRREKINKRTWIEPWQQQQQQQNIIITHITSRSAKISFISFSCALRDPQTARCKSLLNCLHFQQIC